MKTDGKIINGLSESFLQFRFILLMVSIFFLVSDGISQSGNAQEMGTKVVLLGTGTPNPDPEHSGNSIAIIVNNTPYIIDFGPGLGEIGDKLAREAFYESILDPSGAISFGYEGFVVATKAGASYVGFVASDGESELGLKVPGGALVTLKREEIASQTPLPVSLMPAGLAATMSQAELVDLVEYLTTLKKK